MSPFSCALAWIAAQKVEAKSSDVVPGTGQQHICIGRPGDGSRLSIKKRRRAPCAQSTTSGGGPALTNQMISLLQ
ncbi:uncharacterized protein LOC119176529 isoform X2 [Rhipicephalus microplus]|uniref:uncharacterized protein LOC119176529 isoform X2 n=1 Tax=Rhipicephalus microplus TaxID=6941 RepID=UPI003F6B0AEB